MFSGCSGEKQSVTCLFRKTYYYIFPKHPHETEAYCSYFGKLNIHINPLSVRGYDNIDEGFSGLFCASAQLVQVCGGKTNEFEGYIEKYRYVFL